MTILDSPDIARRDAFAGRLTSTMLVLCMGGYVGQADSWTGRSDPALLG
jgi:hypothetical protein